MNRTRIKIIEGDRNLVFTENGNVRKMNKFVENLTDMDDVEFWEKRLNSLNIVYCLTYYKNVGYTIFSDYRDHCLLY